MYRISVTNFIAVIHSHEVKNPLQHKYLKKYVLSFRRSRHAVSHLNVLYFSRIYRGADKSLARPGRKQANVSDRMTCISFGALPCRKNNLMTARVSMLLKSRTSLTCFRACFLPGQANDLSAPQYTT